MLKMKDVDVTGGPLLKSILLYSIPIMLGSLIQNLFNAADTVVLGNMADKVAVSAVGATGPIVGLLVNSFVGLSVGTNVILARLIGAKREKEAKVCVSTSMIAALALGCFFGVLGFFLSEPMLGLMGCPEECFFGAALYLKLYFLGAPAIMVYNFGAAIIRVSGDTQRPLYYLIASGLLNVVMNILFCVILNEKVAAVAIATLASQILGAILVVVRLLRVEGCYRLDLKNARFSFVMFGRVIRCGLPCALNNALYNISNLQIQSAINAYGPDAIAGNHTAASVEGIAASFTSAFGTATVAFVGQNLGTGNKKRVNRSLLYCLAIGALLGLVLGVGLYSIGREILSLYIPGETAAIEYGLIRMAHILAFYAVASMKDTIAGALQAFGYSSIPMIDSIVTVLLFRVFWMTFIYPRYSAVLNYDSISNLYLCYTVSWILCAVTLAAIFAFVFARYLRGKVREV